MEMLDYRDLLSVEMMHCKNDGKFYFTEINLRNDRDESIYNKDICKCSSCGGKIIPLPTEQHFIKPKPHMLC